MTLIDSPEVSKCLHKETNMSEKNHIHFIAVLYLLLPIVLLGLQLAHVLD